MGNEDIIRLSTITLSEGKSFKTLDKAIKVLSLAYWSSSDAVCLSMSFTVGLFLNLHKHFVPYDHDLRDSKDMALEGFLKAPCWAHVCLICP